VKEYRVIEWATGILATRGVAAVMAIDADCKKGDPNLAVDIDTPSESARDERVAQGPTCTA